LRNDVIDIINRQKAEIERLSSDRYLLKEDGTMTLLPRMDVSKIKAEAIKEFADNLMEDALDIPMYGRVVREFDIEHRVKEMVGERE
jgi:hypothetical protein